MSGRRHLGRTSAARLSADGTLFGAIRSFIGQKLRERYAPPKEVPPEMLRLLTQLDETQSEIQEIASEPACERLTSADIEPAK